MLVLVSSIDAEQARLSDGEAAGASNGQDSLPPALPSAAEALPSAEELFRGIYGPEDAVVGSYRTAVSPVVATDEVSTSAGTMRSGLASPPARAAPIVNEASVAVPVKLERPHEFALGTVVFTKFNVAENCNQFFRGRIVELLADGGYRVQYDDGDVFSVERQYLFTQEQVRVSFFVWSRWMGWDGLAVLIDGHCLVVMYLCRWRTKCPQKRRVGERARPAARTAAAASSCSVLAAFFGVVGVPVWFTFASSSSIEE